MVPLRSSNETSFTTPFQPLLFVKKAPPAGRLRNIPQQGTRNSEFTATLDSRCEAVYDCWGKTDLRFCRLRRSLGRVLFLSSENESAIRVGVHGGLNLPGDLCAFHARLIQPRLPHLRWTENFQGHRFLMIPSASVCARISQHSAPPKTPSADLHFLKVGRLGVFGGNCLS